MEALPPWAVQRMAQCLVEAKSPSDATKRHLAVVQELSGAKAVFISILDGVRNVLAVSAVRGRITAAVSVATPGEGIIGAAFASARLAEDRDGGHVAIPLCEAGKPYAVLSLLSPRLKATAEVWQAVADHLTAGVMVAELRDAATRRTRDLETAVAGLRSLDRAHDELLGNVSHDLKSPLTTVKAYLGMARKEKLGPLNDKQKQAFEICERNADRLLRLINEMLLMSRLQAGRMTLDSKPFGLKGLLEEAALAMAPLAEGAGVTVKVARAGEIFIKGDRDRMREAVVNLLENGIHYGRKGGKVEMVVRGEAGVATLQISDDGVGVAPVDLPHVFDRFYKGQGRSKRSGAGLGLALVRQIARLHGGSVSMHSVLNEGTQITLKLPLFAGAVALTEVPLDEAEPLGGEGILLVEDDDDCREVVKQVLESEGFSVAAMAGLEDANRYLSASRPGLVLLDLRLGGSDGRSLLKRIREDQRLAHTPVFVISGAADSEAGFAYDGPERIDGFFEKPLNMQRIIERVRATVRPVEQSAG